MVRPSPSLRAKSSRKRSGRAPGGQRGHPGAYLPQVEDPDVVVEHRPEVCGGCGDELPGGAEVVGWRRRQVFDLPPIRAVVTEHCLGGVECGCGHVRWADPPAGAQAPTSYGPRLKAAALYLYQHQFLSRGRAATAMGDLFGVPVSGGVGGELPGGVLRSPGPVHGAGAPGGVGLAGGRGAMRLGCGSVGPVRGCTRSPPGS
jgi:hypothetical protein